MLTGAAAAVSRMLGVQLCDQVVGRKGQSVIYLLNHAHTALHRSCA